MHYHLTCCYECSDQHNTALTFPHWTCRLHGERKTSFAIEILALTIPVPPCVAAWHVRVALGYTCNMSSLVRCTSHAGSCNAVCAEWTINKGNNSSKRELRLAPPTPQHACTCSPQLYTQYGVCWYSASAMPAAAMQCLQSGRSVIKGNKELKRRAQTYSTRT